MGQNGKLMPNLDQQSTMTLNLTVLQRGDPFVEEILITAGHVTLYEFNVELGQWSRKDVEGSFFVVKRNSQPRFQFIVMNRRSTENLVENLLGDFEFEVQVPYLLYRNAAQEVNGIWFYNTKECEEVATLFSRILSAYAKVPQKPIATPSTREFEELEAVPTLDVIDGPLEPPASTADYPDDPSFDALSIKSANQMYPIPSPAPTCSSVDSTAHLPSSSPLISLLEGVDYGNNSGSFFTSSSAVGPSVMPSAPLLGPSASFTYGSSPLLQPFPPPLLPRSLAPAAPAISREKVREALTLLVQDNEFVDMVYRAIVNSHS